jgi:hypothetical protein
MERQSLRAEEIARQTRDKALIMNLCRIRTVLLELGFDLLPTLSIHHRIRSRQRSNSGDRGTDRETDTVLMHRPSLFVAIVLKTPIKSCREEGSPSLRLRFATSRFSAPSQFERSGEHL